MQPFNTVQVVSSTWARASHDLFDFECTHLQTKHFTVSRGSYKFFRSGTDVQMIGEHAGHAPAGVELLFRIAQKDGSFYVEKERGASSSSAKYLWLVVRDQPNAIQRYRLSEADIIRLGRFKFRVRQTVFLSSEDVRPELRLDDNVTVCDADVDMTPEADRCCRICLLEGSSEDDPLIRPCQCKGTIEHVHLGCLRHWISGRLNLSDARGGSYFYRPLLCELCKVPYPAYVQMGQNRVPLVEVPRTKAPYIVLETMVRDSNANSRGLHVISLAENKVLKIGRGHDSDVRIADVSISRCHATIQMREGAFCLEDNKSKFGTLVAMKKPRRLNAAGSPISIQVGRTVLNIAEKAALRAHGVTEPAEDAASAGFHH